MEVPFLDLKAQNRGLKAEILPLWAELLESASFIGGKHVTAFEKEFANACSVDYCVTVNSGTDALRFIFMALGLQPGDEVITVPNTFIATTEAVTQAGGNILFVDIDSHTYNMDPLKLESEVTPKTKGIVLGFGLRCGMGLRLPNGVASASSSDSNRGPDRAFDGDNGTQWQNQTQQPGWQYLQMAWNGRQTITRIALRFGDHYPEDYQFKFKIGRWKRWSNWKWSTKIPGNDRKVRAHVWFKPKKNVWATRLYCLTYSSDDYYSVVEMKIQR